jgi:hypothetical protein
MKLSWETKISIKIACFWWLVFLVAGVFGKAKNCQ